MHLTGEIFISPAEQNKRGSLMAIRQVRAYPIGSFTKIWKEPDNHASVAIISIESSIGFSSNIKNELKFN